ncbi:thiopurine S-methyltransferase [Pseudomonas duriflava]|uniref:Thiopurine S-methyltransferase n=1 Tax=Pseudomonas duriflava TaxID=459528 RepID=A0A562Q2U8_9PSED|nr:thiopurine S-methyltransferase [Pseudomonas duriflava]TWI51003.1 thiopurine S-methyltransferase [Pseudomonas duriflava]
MDTPFWLNKWERNEIGFHSLHANSYLKRHWESLEVSAGSVVLVPLCGKSIDMVWLAEQGFQVLGVELSSLAVEAFFEEQGLVPVCKSHGTLRHYKAGPFTILQGDFFALTPADMPVCSAVYDRAALIALPEAMRYRYVRHLETLMPAGEGLLITLEYDQAKRAGPPFAVSDDEVHRLYEPAWRLETLERKDVLAENAKFAAQGVMQLSEAVYKLSSLAR